jgi:urease accessory protein
MIPALHERDRTMLKRSWSAARAAALLLGSLTLSSAQAHHAMGGQTPATVAQGLLSGLAHPVIEVDHFLFLLGAAVVVAAARLPLPVARLALLLFAAAGLGGTLLHVRGINLPAAEIGVALTLLLAAAGLLRPRVPVLLAWGAAAAAGLLHGYAYGESIVGAEPRPLIAYLVGLALVQAVLLVGVHAAWLRLAAWRPLWQAGLRSGLALLLGLVGAWALIA